MRIARHLVPLALLAYLCACSSAPHTITSEQRGPRSTGQPYETLLVIGVYTDRPFRISGEVGLAEALEEHGVRAVPSYERIPDLSAFDNVEAVKRAARDAGADAILTVLTTEVNEDYDYGDALATRGWVRLLGGQPGLATESGILLDYLGSGTYSLHLALIDAESFALSWELTTNSTMQDSTTDEIESLAKLVVERMETQGLIAQQR